MGSNSWRTAPLRPPLIQGSCDLQVLLCLRGRRAGQARGEDAITANLAAVQTRGASTLTLGDLELLKHPGADNPAAMLTKAVNAEFTCYSL